MSFLTAEWRKLILANYEVDPAILKAYLPYKTELDVWQGTHYVSLVGFMFLDTRLLGLPIPFHRNFEEVNLRFYVRYKGDGGWKRGVVFIKEFVPKYALTFVANTFYQENYQTVKMTHSWDLGEDLQHVSYEWGKGNRLSVKASKDPKKVEGESEAGFITEHYWGYTQVSPKKTFEYEVTHPTWETCDVLDYEIEVDFKSLYGVEFSGLQDSQPKSIMLAEGSRITVENKSLIT